MGPEYRAVYFDEIIQITCEKTEIVPSVYLVLDAEVEAFDITFPPREKLRLPGQLFG